MKKSTKKALVVGGVAVGAYLLVTRTALGAKLAGLADGIVPMVDPVTGKVGMSAESAAELGRSLYRSANTDEMRGISAGDTGSAFSALQRSGRISGISNRERESVIRENGGEMTPSEIAENVFREKNSVTAVINTMERQGVVRREPSSEDRRSVKVVITDKGWQEANRLNPVAQELSLIITRITVV